MQFSQQTDKVFVRNFNDSAKFKGLKVTNERQDDEIVALHHVAQHPIDQVH